MKMELRTPHCGISWSQVEEEALPTSWKSRRSNSAEGAGKEKVKLSLFTLRRVVTWLTNVHSFIYGLDTRTVMYLSSESGESSDIREETRVFVEELVEER